MQNKRIGITRCILSNNFIHAHARGARAATEPGRMSEK